MGAFRGKELIQGLLVVAAIAAAVGPMPPALIERYYSAWLYPPLQHLLTPISNLFPFALFDLFVLSTAALCLVWLIRQLKPGRGIPLRATARRVLLGAAAFAAALYLAFLVVWGLNYRRVPLADKLAFDPRAISSARARVIAEETVARMNGLYEGAHTELAEHSTLQQHSLARAFARAERDLGIPPAVPGRPKATLFDWYFRRAGVAGMTDPFFLETLVATDLLPFERPFVVAHEWAHLAGLADESEANFAGWLACLRGTPAEQYSGWLFLYGEIAGSLPQPARRDLAAQVGPGPRRDLIAIRERLERQVNPRVSAAGWRAYDRYLRANRVESGTASYAEVVRLVLGVRFTGDWIPTRAPQP